MKKNRWSKKIEGEEKIGDEENRMKKKRWRKLEDEEKSEMKNNKRWRKNRWRETEWKIDEAKKYMKK